MSYPTCSIRKDLLQKNLSIPLHRGNDIVYTSISKPFKYRYVNPDTEYESFEVLYNGEWLEACSMDFEF